VPVAGSEEQVAWAAAAALEALEAPVALLEAPVALVEALVDP
jgi:hypothetical protein